jgi:hypothetical protein
MGSVPSDENMTQLESSDERRTTRTKRVARRIFEFITAAGFLLVILYWPTTNIGRLILIAAAVVWLVGLRFLFKWPSV